MREQQAAQREFHPEGQTHVERVEMGHQIPVGRRRKDDCRAKARHAIEYSRAGIANQQHAGKPRQCGIEPRLPFADPEPRERQRVRPGLQRRFLEIFVAVVSRCDPVTGHEHFAGHFRVPAFVAGNEMAQAEGRKPDHSERCDQQ